MEPGAPPTNRLNDGRCDARGRYWVGSLNTDQQSYSGALHRLDPDGRAHSALYGPIGVGNGIAFSPDDRHLFLADSRTRQVLRFPFDLDEGRIGPTETLIDLSDELGRPDGAAVDTDGCYWTAMVYGAAILRITPDGRIDRRIPLPVSHPTMCSFGGAKLDRLFVTSARRFLSDAEIKAQPQNGHLHVIDGLGSQGFAPHRIGIAEPMGRG